MNSVTPQMVVLAKSYVQERQIHNQSIYSSKEKALSYLQWKWSNIVNLPHGCWLVTLGNGAIFGAQHWYLLLEDLALSSSFSPISLAE